MRFFLSLALYLFSLSALATHGQIITSVGTIKFQLYDQQKPRTVHNFIGLATGEKTTITPDGKKQNKPFYDGLIVHRIHPDLGFFTGCPWGTGRGWPGYFIQEEPPGSSNFDRAGLIAMAKLPGDDRIGSQFFITTKPSPHLNGRYTIFGEVTGGLDVVKKIAAAPRTVTMKPRQTITIKRIELNP